jgi:hypothetical protein
MTSAERLAKIESYGRAPEDLAAALKEFPREMWKYKPAPDRWSIHEIIIHLADSEANSFIRGRVFLAEPGKTIMAYDQDKWTRELDYHSQDTDLALDLFRCLRKSTYLILHNQPMSVWERTIVHPEAGLMTMDKWLEIYEHHIPGHINQMRNNFEAWKKSKSS